MDKLENVGIKFSIFYHIVYVQLKQVIKMKFMWLLILVGNLRLLNYNSITESSKCHPIYFCENIFQSSHVLVLSNALFNGLHPRR